MAAARPHHLGTMTLRRVARLALALALASWGAAACDRTSPARPKDCADACAAGATTCDTGGAQLTCLEPPSAEACRGWSAPRACGPLQACVAGACTCLSPCQPGWSVCDSDAAARPCAGPDADGCYDWGAPVACADGIDCTGGSCGCETACPLGATACGPTGARLTCVAGAGACPEWQAEDCGPHRVCASGACRCADPCAAGQTECSADGAGVIACAGPDADGCRYWGETVACVAPDVCAPDVGPAEVAACVTFTPPGCADINECDFAGQKKCMSDTQYRECFIRPDDGCLRLDCFS
jgi:hypothetical protein